MAFAKCTPAALWRLLIVASVTALRNDVDNVDLFAMGLDNSFNSSSELDDFVNASMEESLSTCTIRSPTAGRELTLGITLGEGAEGTVYKARDMQGKYAAVKILKPGKQLDMKEVANMKKLSEVRSKHINNLEPGFENVQTCCGRPCLVTEIINGLDAAKIMWMNGIKKMDDVRAGKGRKGSLTYQVLRSILLQSLAAFRDTESAGLCNYDQHLRNVMFEEATERIVFIDFGFASSSLTCVPSSPFKPDYESSLLQSFRSLAYLLADEGDKQAYLQLCDRITSMKYKSAKELLLREAFAASPPSPDSPGVFFSRHKDEVITLQLKALLDTGSPHIGKVSGRGPWENADGAPPPQAHIKQGGGADQARHAVVVKQSSQPSAQQGSGRPEKPEPAKAHPMVGRDEAPTHDCCAQGGCIFGSTCFGKKDGYAINQQWCASNRGTWCR